MQNNKLFKGIMPAAFTPFDGEGGLMPDAARKMLRAILDKGVHGFYINGSTGEGLFLQESTRREMAEAAVEICRGRGVVINHVGAVDNTAAIRLAKHAGQIGCDAVASLVPNYIITYPKERILDYYKRLRDASGLPVLVYCMGNIGGDPFDFMQSVMAVDGLIGCKYTMFDYFIMHRIAELNGGNINVINGPDQMLICGLMMGADGGIGTTYNLMPGWFLELYAAFRAGDYEKARETQFKINRVIAVLLKHDCIPACKEVFRVNGYDIGQAAYPGKVFDSASRKALLDELAAAGYVFDI